MSPCHPDPETALAGSIHELLAAVRRRFYTTKPATDFYRDRSMLLYALSWPAIWLERRSLTCSPQRYQSIIMVPLAAITAHGDPTRYGAYFPTYLLKCLQNSLQHQGDELYRELKHVRNALVHVLASVRFADQVKRDARQLDLLAATHRLIHANRTRRSSDDPAQLSLF